MTTSESLEGKRTFWIVTGAALLFRALLLVGTGPDPRYALTSDSPSYYRPALILKTTGEFANDATGLRAPEFYRTPGYPVFLMPFVSNETPIHHRAVQWTQAVLGAVSAGVLSLCALVFWKDQKAAILAGSALALDFVYAIHSLFVLTDAVFVFVITLALYACVRQKYAICGALTAVAAFVRPVGVYYPVLLGGFLLVMLCRRPSRQQLLSVALFLLFSILPLAGWMARNHSYTGRWTFSAIQDANLYYVRVALLESQAKHISYEEAVKELEQKRSAAPGQGNENQWAMDYLRAHPGAYARFLVKDALKLFSGNSMKIAAWALLKDEQYAPNASPVHSLDSPLSQARTLMTRHPGLGGVLMLYFFFLLATYALCLRGLWNSVQRYGWVTTLILFSTVIYYTGVTLGTDAQARYRLPLLPALFLFAGGGYRMIVEKEERREKTQ